MTKKELLYFLIENTKLDDNKFTPLKEIREAYLNGYGNFSNLNMYIGLFLKCLYEDDLKKTEQGYNIKVNVKSKFNKIIDGSIKGVYKKVNITEELQNLNNNVYLANKNGNIINIVTNNHKELIYLIPNVSGVSYYLGKFKKLESWRK